MRVPPRDAARPGRTVVVVAALLLARTVAATPTLDPPADPICAALAGECAPPPYVGIMTAFPGEIAPLLAAARVTSTIEIGERTYYVGTLARTPVVLVRGGIGFANAIGTAHALIERFALTALLFSGVAGSGLNIGDVAVPAVWRDGASAYPVDPTLLAAAATLAAPPIVLESCTPVPPEPLVCLPNPPKVVVGGEGESADPYGGTAVPCVPDAGPVFGCDLRAEALEAPADATDMETAAVAKVASEAGLPFLGFRGVSDGGGDPLGLPGFPGQFFAYYQLAADNAAAVVVAFLDRLATGADVAPDPSRQRIGAACDWARVAGPVCATAQPRKRLTTQVDRACASVAKGGTAKRTRKHWRRAAARARAKRSLAASADCRAALAAALAARAKGEAP